MSPLRVQYFYDVVCPHAWILFEQLCAAERTHRSQLELRPVCNSSLMSSVGNSSPFYLAAPRAYLFDEAEFLGKVHELGLTVPKNAKETLSATGTSRAQAFLAFVAEEHPDNLRGCSRNLWQRLWVHDKPVHRSEDFNEVLRGCDMAVDLSEADVADERWSKKLRANEQIAVDSEAFGVPWTLVETNNGSKKAFFGSDKWPLISSLLDATAEKPVMNNQPPA